MIVESVSLAVSHECYASRRSNKPLKCGQPHLFGQRSARLVKRTLPLRVVMSQLRRFAASLRWMGRIQRLGQRNDLLRC